MLKWGLLAGAIMLCVAGRARAEDNWACSVIDDGEAQVIKLTVGKDGVRASDWRSRLGDSLFKDSDFSSVLKLVLDGKDALVAVDEPYVERETGKRHRVVFRTYVIDKRTGELSYATVSTVGPPVEIKGSCVK